MNAVFAPRDLHPDRREHRAEIALYVETLAGSLATLVQAAGLAAMSDTLRKVAAEAAHIARDLARTHHASDA